MACFWSLFLSCVKYWFIFFFLILHVTVFLNFGLFLELVFVLCEILIYFLFFNITCDCLSKFWLVFGACFCLVWKLCFSLLKPFLVKSRVIIYWPYWPTDYPLRFVLVIFYFCSICLFFVYICIPCILYIVFVCNVEIKFDLINLNAPPIKFMAVVCKEYTFFFNFTSCET